MSIKQKDIIELDLIIGIAAANNSTLNGNSEIERSYKTLVKLISDNKRMNKIINDRNGVIKEQREDLQELWHQTRSNPELWSTDYICSILSKYNKGN